MRSHKPKEMGIVKSFMLNYVAPIVIATAGFLGCGDSGSGGGDPPVNNAPLITSLPLEDVVVGNSYNYDVDADDPDLDTVTYNLVSAPAWAGINSTTGEITGTPTSVGVESFSVEATDGDLSDTQDFDVAVSSVTEDLTGKVNYIIVTNSDMSGAFQNLADWKTSKGVGTEVHLVSDIESGYSGRDTQEKIRNFIKSEKVSHPELEYILLGGDVEVVPHRQVSASCSIPLTDNTMPCDLYFSDLDGDWDANTNNIFGETTDNVEMHPDVFVGRAPVNDSTEANVFVTKVRNYEQGNVDLSYIKKVLFMAEKLSVTCNAAVAKDWINPNVFDFGANEFTVTGLYEELPAGGVGTLDKTTAMDAMNTGGHHVINIYGHGGETGLGVGSGLNYVYCDGTDPSADVRDLTNNTKPSIVYSLGCHSNHFDNTTSFPNGDCILEELILNPNGGAVAAIGGSRIGLYNTSLTNGTGISWDYDVEFFDTLYNNGSNNLGKVFADSKETYADTSKTNQDYKWMQFCLNLLGDPEMPVWKNHAGDISATVSGTDHKEIDVTDGTNPLVGASVFIKQGSNVYKTPTDSNGKAVFNVSGAVDSVVVTMDEYKPFIQ